MKEESTVLKDIAEKVHAFCDDIIAGKVGDELLQRHKIPSGYLDVCRDSNHPSSKKLEGRRDRHLSHSEWQHE